MKKFFSLMIALVAAMAINAQGTDLYIGGINGSWPEPGTNPAYKFSLDAAHNSYTISFERVEAGSELKVFVGEGWGNDEWGAAAEGDSIVPNGASYQLVSTNAKNLKIVIPANHYLKNATIRVTEEGVATILCEEIVDASAETPVYCLCGACTDNWSTTAAIEFEDVDGVLTATIPNLNGGFKIIKNHKWGWEAAANGTEALGFNTPMTLVTEGGNNINLANPFGGYNNAVVTLDVTDEANPVITLVGGEFAMGEVHWYFPGSKLGWNCDASTEFEPVAGVENTYEYLAAEFGKDFKVVFGVWGVEFGAPKGETLNWVTNEPMELTTPCDNVSAEDNDLILQDVIATIVVDYEAITCVLTLEVEETAFEQIAADKDVVKVIENGKVVVIKNGVRYSVKGAKL